MKTRWTWTNWTFGVWWSRGTINRRKNMVGVDLGPFEAIYTWRRRQS